jgi:mannose-6-phosphate isomerase
VTGSPLAERAKAARRWLFDHAFPLWSSAGFDGRTGQFVEQLTLEGEPLAGVARRTLVQARQIYVFCTAGRLGWNGPWRKVADAATDTLLARGRDTEGDWIFSFDGDGRPADLRADLYTQAFVIFGLSHAGQLLARADALDAARRTCQRLDAAWAHSAGGFVEGAIEPLRRQNPHMHLLEAYLALHAATGEPVQRARAEQIGALLTDRLLVREPVGLIEFFDEAWRPVEPVELWPGHHYEWAWLLDQLQRASGADRSAEAEALLARAEALGAGARNVVVDSVWLDGSPKDRGGRLWPQAERLKALLALRGHDDAAILAGLDVLEAAFDTPVRGAWRDRRLPDGAWEAGPALASSGYHIVAALEALIHAAGI